jgi:hypothetical protein
MSHIIICDNSRTILKVVEDVDKSNVDVDSFKRWISHKDGIEHGLVLKKLLNEQIILESLFKFKGKFT